MKREGEGGESLEKGKKNVRKLVQGKSWVRCGKS